MTRPTVLFLCTHNAGRSQLGAALLEHLAGDRFVVTSAGTDPATAVNPAIAAAVGELGIEISARVPRRVTAHDVAAADVVVAMKPGLDIPGRPKRLLEWSFPDPAAWNADGARVLREAVGASIMAEFGPVGTAPHVA